MGRGGEWNGEERKGRGKWEVGKGWRRKGEGEAEGK